MASSGRKALFFLFLLTAGLLITTAAQEPATPPQKPRIDWQLGPGTGKLGDIAEINIPEGYRFTGRQGALTVMQLTHNPASGHELGVMIPNNGSWFMIFEFENTGYVKDDDKNNLNADSILESIKNGTEHANEKRKANGWKAFHVTGWQTTPFYDPETHNLTWAILGKGDDPTDTGSVNHSIRVLGRRGTMNVDLVVEPAEYSSSKPEFNSLISGLSFSQGNRYADFRAGDKVAEYGLAALIAGGAGAVLLKTGLLAKFWKLIVVAIVAIGGFIKKIFKAIFGGNETKIEDPNKQAAAQG
ncbi:MAG TPA: DUF2167 domain-containing protein [Candidatus Angelobacter sp.]|nr:DUF2167 domain-containing protein [Candidatus Angelobacter sp.]